MNSRKRLQATVLGLAVASAVMVDAVPLGRAAAPQAAQTATQFYMTYRAAFAKAKKIEDLLPYMSAETRKQVESTPKEEREKIFGMIKMLDSHTNIKVTREDRQADGSLVLSVSAFDTEQKKDVTADVTIVKEAGAWKLGKENWKSGS
jgi:hypothetical protein